MIEFKEVGFRYPGGNADILNDLSFSIPAGGVTALMGANGSGKSTAALCMNGTLRPARGSVLVDGMGTTVEENRVLLKKAVGIVFQDPNLQFTSMTVEREIAFGLENLAMERDQMREKVETALARFDLHRMRRDPPWTLSGGEKQRLALAAMAVLSPRYLVLDEATTLLSPGVREKVLGFAVEDVRERGSALVLITQFPEEAQRADRVLVMDRGTKVLEGAPSVLDDNAEFLHAKGVPVSLRSRLAVDDN